MNGTTGKLAELDASKLQITLSSSLKPIPPPKELVFGKYTTDHMLVSSFDPDSGWSAPEIKPYQNLSLDPASSCFQYCPNVFEGMKAYLGKDGEVRLFRPEKNMQRLTMSVDRVALPPFNTDELLKLIKELVLLDKRWIPRERGYSLYIRPTVIGTRPSLGVTASTHSMIYIILSPTGPFFPSGIKPVSLLAIPPTQFVRAWPGGTGGFKLGLNYAPAFLMQRMAKEKGYDQILGLLGAENGVMVGEAGAMNFFAVVLGEGEGVLDVHTPPLDGTILPGITRASCLDLLRHPSFLALLSSAGVTRINVHDDQPLSLSSLLDWDAAGKLVEAFGVGTAVIVAPIGRIGIASSTSAAVSSAAAVNGNGNAIPEPAVKDILFPTYKAALGPIGEVLYQRIVDIQEGRIEWEGWGVRC